MSQIPNSVAVQCVLVISCEVSSDFKLPNQTLDTKLPNQTLDQETIGEILKTCKNDFNWLEMSFFIKEDIFDRFCKVSSDFK